MNKVLKLNKENLSLLGQVVISKRKRNDELEKEIGLLTRYRKDIIQEIKEVKRREYLCGRKNIIQRLFLLLSETHKKINDLIELESPVNIGSYFNLTTTVGRTSICNRLSGGGNDCDITYGAIGDTVASPAVGDTQLVNEIYRASVSSIVYTGTQIRIRLFVPSGSGNPGGGTLYDFGWFGDGATGIVNSGVMFNHVSISESKTSSYSLTVDGYININDA